MKAKWMMGAVLAGATMLTTVAVAQDNFSSSDKDFLKDSAQGNVAEVELAKLALQKSSNADVKQFAHRMIKDHEMLQKKMKPFVQAAGVSAEDKLNSEHQEEYDKLKGLSGNDFNKEYVEYMDKDHHKDLQHFHDEISSTQNPKLKVAVEKGEAVIQEHVNMIDKIDKQMGMTPA